MNNDELCHCGRPLHYLLKQTRAYVERIIAAKGTHVIVTVGNRSWSVPRHYIALHGLNAEEIDKLGFEELPRPLRHET